MATPVPTVEEILKSLEEGEPSAAARLLDRLAGSSLAVTEVLPRIWESFRTLLRRRGFFVDSPNQVSTTLREIAEIGEGFDLHDLALTLARLDASAPGANGTARGPRSIPELDEFTRGCTGNRHAQKGEPA